MWTWSRSTLEDFAPLASVVVVVLISLGIGRLREGDIQGGAWLLVLAGLGSVHAGLGWYFRRSRPEDPWQPR